MINLKEKYFENPIILTKYDFVSVCTHRHAYYHNWSYLVMFCHKGSRENQRKILKAELMTKKRLVS